MADAIGQVIPLGIAVAFSPLPIIAVVLLLAAPTGRRHAFAFAAGGLVAVVVIGAVAVLALGAAGADEGSGGGPSTGVSIARLVLGILLLRVALRQWRARPQPGADPELPAWMQKADTLSAPRSAGMGVLLCGVNPKNLILILAAAATIAATGASTADQAAALAVFVALAMLGVGLPIAASVLLGDRATATLDDVRAWMVRENSTIIAVIALLIGAKLIGDAVSGLAG